MRKNTFKGIGRLKGTRHRLRGPVRFVCVLVVQFPAVNRLIPNDRKVRNRDKRQTANILPRCIEFLRAAMAPIQRTRLPDQPLKSFHHKRSVILKPKGLALSSQPLMLRNWFWVLRRHDQA